MSHFPAGSQPIKVLRGHPGHSFLSHTTSEVTARVQVNATAPSQATSLVVFLWKFSICLLVHLSNLQTPKFPMLLVPSAVSPFCILNILWIHVCTIFKIIFMETLHEFLLEAFVFTKVVQQLPLSEGTAGSSWPQSLWPWTWQRCQRLWAVVPDSWPSWH